MMANNQNTKEKASILTPRKKPLKKKIEIIAIMTKSIHNKLFISITLTLFKLTNASINRWPIIQTSKETVFFDHLI